MPSKLVEEELEALITDKKLEELETELDKFNLFEILNVTKSELIHSNILKWLCSPEESHNLSDYFLKKFLIDVLQKNKDHRYKLFSAVQIDSFDFSHSLVLSEEVFSNQSRGDISVINETHNIYILIENKIFSSENNSQTMNYVEQSKSRYPGYKCLYIYLTPNQDATPESDEFIPYSYSDFIQVCKEVISSKCDLLTDNTLLLINQFIRNLEVNVLSDSKIEELCLQIYQTHKKAIDKIFEIKPTNKQAYDSLGQDVCKILQSGWKYHASNSFCAIYKDEWKNKFNPSAKLSFFHYEFNDIGQNRVKISLHVESFGNLNYKEAFKKNLNNTGITNVAGINLSKGQSIFAKNSVLNIIDMDRDLEKSKKDMVELINSTVSFLDEAAKKMTVIDDS